MRKLIVSPYADPKKLEKQYDILEILLANKDLVTELKQSLHNLSQIEYSYTQIIFVMRK